MFTSQMLLTRFRAVTDAIMSMYCGPLPHCRWFSSIQKDQAAVLNEAEGTIKS